MTLHDLEDLIDHHTCQERLWAEGSEAQRDHAKWIRALRALRDEMLDAREMDKLWDSTLGFWDSTLG